MALAQALTAISPAPAPAAEPASRVGPNAVIQLAETLRVRLGERTARRVFADAGLGHWLDELPASMVDERDAAALFATLFAELPTNAARSVAAEAGARTADYILAHRIPRFAQLVLKALPAGLAAPLLLGAIRRHAWTFAGSGGVEARAGSPSVIEIADNPLAMPGCVWHAAVFRRLFHVLVTRSPRVDHPLCCHDGAAVCRFEIAIK